jgi:Spy/CpxP family protein refolding chaperone
MKKFLSVLAVAALLGTGLSFAADTVAPSATPVKKAGTHHKHHHAHLKGAVATPVAAPVK